jgi:hypothetical protein
MLKIKKDKIIAVAVISLVVMTFIVTSVLAFIAYQNLRKSSEPDFGNRNLVTSYINYGQIPVVPVAPEQVKEPIPNQPAPVLPTPAPVIPPPAVTPPPVPTLSNYALRVMVVNYNPVENGVNSAEKFYKYAMGNRTAKQAEDYAYNSVINHFKKLSNNRINYQVVKSLDINEFPTYPDGFKFDFNTYSKCVWGTTGFDPDWCESQKVKFDYIKWTKDYKICEIAEANNVDEIWTLSLPYIMRYENFMLGPDQGFDVNGESYTVNTCHKHYIVLGGAYNSPDNLMHDIGHRVEATMTYITSVWNGNDYDKYWVNFARWGTGNNNTANTCGNTHFPTNATSDYEYSSSKTESSSCADWKNFPNLTGTRVNVNCNSWGCTDSGWQEYWLGSLPSSAGEVTMTSNKGKQFSFKKDWWYYLLYPENAIKFVKEHS